MKPSTPKRIKKMGWGVIDSKYNILYYPSIHRSLALKWRRENASYGVKIMPDVKVIPITIQFSYPTKIKKL